MMKSTKNGKKKRILLVDDESDINLLFKTILEESEFKVDFYDDPLLACRISNLIHTIYYY